MLNMTDEDTVTDSNPHIYIPAGADSLPLDPVAIAAACDLIDRVARRPTGVAIHAADAQKRYGRPGKHKGPRRYLFDVVCESLIGAGVVETDGGYKVKSHAKEYRLTEQWHNRRRVRAPAIYRKPAERGEGARPVPPWLRYCAESASYDMEGSHLYMLGDVGVDAATGRQLTDACCFGEDPDGGHTAGFNAIGEEIERVAPALGSIVGDRMSSLWRWRVDRVSWAYRDPSGFRLHTPITNMAHELRPFLGFGRLSADTELWEIDAKNSQPVILATLAVQALDTPDARQLAEICAAGQFYEETYLAVYGRYPTKLEREAWKPKIMQTWLYGTVAAQNGSKEGKALARHWPTVHQWIIDKKKAGGVSALPCEMQAAESSIWIDALAPELERRRIPVFTVHDCVIVPASAVDDAHAAVAQVYADAGIVAKLEPTRVAVEAPGALERARVKNEAERQQAQAKAKRRETAKRKAADLDRRPTA